MNTSMPSIAFNLVVQHISIMGVPNAFNIRETLETMSGLQRGAMHERRVAPL